MHAPTPATSLSSATAELIVSLGRPGAHLARKHEHVYLVGTSSAPRQLVSPQMLATLEETGFVTWAAGATVEATATLSNRGRQALRHHLIGDTRSRSGQRAPTRRQGAAALRAIGSAEFGGLDARLTSATVIEQLARRRAGGQPMLSDTQLSAARRFAADFERAELQPRVTARWSAAAVARARRRSAPDARPDLPANTLDAQDRVRRALASLAASLGNLVIDVCGLDRGLEEVEADRGWPRHSSRILLGGALDQLAIHYGLTLCPRPDAGDVLNWGDGRHKPTGRGHSTS